MKEVEKKTNTKYDITNLEKRLGNCEISLVKGSNKIDNFEENLNKMNEKLDTIASKIDFSNGKEYKPEIHIHSTFIDKEAIDEIKAGWQKFKKWMVACGIGAGIGAGGIASWASGLLG